VSPTFGLSTGFSKPPVYILWHTQIFNIFANISAAVHFNVSHLFVLLALVCRKVASMRVSWFPVHCGLPWVVLWFLREVLLWWTPLYVAALIGSLRFCFCWFSGAACWTPRFGAATLDRTHPGAQRGGTFKVWNPLTYILILI